ncbi:hypothetical protein ACLFKQ_05825 [Myxosarcina sp. GI1(2024)]
MNQVILLRQTLKPLLGWHGARVSFLALFLIVFAHLQPGQTQILSGKRLALGTFGLCFCSTSR